MSLFDSDNKKAGTNSSFHAKSLFHTEAHFLFQFCFIQTLKIYETKSCRTALAHSRQLEFDICVNSSVCGKMRSRMIFAAQVEETHRRHTDTFIL